MPQLFHENGIRFQYPDSWQLTREDAENELRAGQLPAAKYANVPIEPRPGSERKLG